MDCVSSLLSDVSELYKLQNTNSRSVDSSPVNYTPAKMTENVVESSESGLIPQGAMTDTTSPALTISKAISAMEATIFYEKRLTSSDANGAGRIVIPKAIAETYFPILENQSGVPINAIDTLGNVYHFRFRFWINNQSRMYLLEGASELQRRYNVRVSDVMIFAHKRDKTLVVAGRPSVDSENLRKSSSKKSGSSNGGGRREQKRGYSSNSRPQAPKRTRKPSTRELHNSINHDFNPFLAPSDGVFRLLLNSRGISKSSIFIQSGVWTAVLDVKGEMYQAFFESQEDALTAFTAAGYTQ